MSSKTGLDTRIALIGATGRVGGWVLETLLERGYTSIQALVRTASKLEAYTDKITIVAGDATNESDMADFLLETDVVISTIGSPNKETLVVEATAKAVLAAIAVAETAGHAIPRILWMTTTGVNEAIPQAKMYTFFGSPASSWLFGYGGFGWVVFNILIPFVIGQQLWDDMGASELAIRSNQAVAKRTVIVRPTNMHPVSEDAVFSEKWRAQGGENTKYECVDAKEPPLGKWMNRRAIASALCDLVQDSSRDRTAISLFQDGDP